MRVILPFIILGAAAAVMVILLLDPFGGEERKPEILPNEQGPALSEITPAKVEEGAERLEVVPEGQIGVLIEGRLYLNGSPLSGVKLQAFADRPVRLPPDMADRIRSSPLYYSAAAKEAFKDSEILRDFADQSWLPTAACTSDKDGTFSFSVGADETVSLEIDHDFYFLSREEKGPFTLTEDTDPITLNRFDGKLEAELGGMVRGTVTDADDFPLEGVMVMLLPEEENEGFFGRFGGNASSARDTVTDGEGEFMLRGVEPDQPFRVVAKSEGLAQGRTEAFETRAGEVTTLEVRLHEGAAVLVQVRGPEGKPLAGTEVFLEKEEEEEAAQSRGGRGMGGMFSFGSQTIAGAGETDEDGEVFFDALNTGRFNVKACYPGLLQARTDQAVSVKENEEPARIKLTLTFGHTISGRVIDDLERPVKEAKVQALPHSARSGGFRGGDFRGRMEAAAAPPADLKECLSAADGSFTVTGLAEAKAFDLYAEHEKLVPAEYREVEAGSGDVVLVMVRPGQIRGRVIGALTGKPVNRFTIHIVPEPEDRGRRDRGGRGRMEFGRRGDPRRDERPPSAERELMATLGNLMWRGPGPSLSPTDREEDFRDADGNFELLGIVPGRYLLCVSADGFAPILTEPVEVIKGEVVKGVTVSLGPGGIMQGKTLSDLGPVNDARIRIEEQERDESLRLLLDTLDESRSNREGAFQIKNLPAGRFVLRASHPDHPSVSSDELTIVEGQLLSNLALRFPPAARIIGTALDESGAPLKNENVLCRGVERGFGGFNRKRTDDEGRFEFDDLRAGTYSLSIFSGMGGFRFGRGGDSEGMEVTVAEGEVAEILLQDKTPEGATIRGIITDDTGAVGPGFLTVSLAEGGGRGSMRNGSIAEDGTYEVEGVMPGLNRFTLRFATSGSFETSTLDFEIPDLNELLLDIRLPGGRISGVVLDAVSRYPLSDVRISLSREGESQDRGNRGMRGRWGGGRSAVTGKDGTFRFRMLSAGTYNIEARPTGELDSGEGTGYYTAEVTGLPLAEGQVKEDVKVYLGPGGGIQVKVVDESNTPVDGASITAYEEGASTTDRSSGVRGRTNEEGEAILNRVKPGVYTLNIQARQMAQQAVGSVYVSPGQYAVHQVSMTTGFQVSLRLKTTEGESIEGADLTLKNAQGLDLSIRGSRLRGNSYSLGNLPPGQYTVQASWDGKNGSASFNVRQEGTLNVTIQ